MKDLQMVTVEVVDKTVVVETEMVGHAVALVDP